MVYCFVCLSLGWGDRINLQVIDRFRKVLLLFAKGCHFQINTVTSEFDLAFWNLGSIYSYATRFLLFLNIHMLSVLF